MTTAYELLILCCVKSVNIDKCIQVLSWIEYHNHTLTLHLGHIAKLLNKINPTISQLKYIETLIDKNIISESKYIQMIQSALITNYDKHKNIQYALHVFICIENINSYSLNSMLTAMINNGNNKQALDLYNYYEMRISIDNITHYMALKACINLGDFETRKSIHKKLKFSENNKHEIKMKTQLIDFYGIFNDISNAIDIFESVNRNEIDIVCIDANVKVFVNNGLYNETIELFDEMDIKYGNIIKDSTCYVLAIKACANIANIIKGIMFLKS